MKPGKYTLGDDVYLPIDQDGSFGIVREPPQNTEDEDGGENENQHGRTRISQETDDNAGIEYMVDGEETASKHRLDLDIISVLCYGISATGDQLTRVLKKDFGPSYDAAARVSSMVWIFGGRHLLHWFSRKATNQKNHLDAPTALWTVLFFFWLLGPILWAGHAKNLERESLEIRRRQRYNGPC
jgi:hypothetical protein